MRVYAGKQYHWPVGAVSPGIRMYLPIMVTDIILENKQEKRRIIIDTKFTDILISSRFDDSQSFKTGHIYQLYAYLRSQERDDDPLSLNSEGMLLYPSIHFDVDEVAELQGHFVRFVTIDLAEKTSTVVENLRQLPVSHSRQKACDPAENQSVAIA